jgi:hypothetical protein
MSAAPFVLCVDVGGPRKIGWADSVGRVGVGNTLGEALDRLSNCLRAEKRAALGFEAPIWTPAREDLAAITASRGGVEKRYNRAWSAGAGCGALAAALALMPWCLRRIAMAVGPVATTVDLDRFQEVGGLLLWEAFISGKMKIAGATHHDDARVACEAFVERWHNLQSEVPPERATNHAISCAKAAGLDIDLTELTKPAIVIGVSLQTAIDATAS